MDEEAANETHRDVHPTRGRRRGRTLLGVAVMAIVAFWVLPKLINVDAMVAAIRVLDVPDIAVLLALTALRVLSEALIYRALLPGLRLRVGSLAYTSSSVVTVLPPPAPSVVQYAYFRSEGFETKGALTGAAGTFVFPQAGRLVLPLLAFVGLVVARRVDGTAWAVAGVSLGAVVLAAAAVRLVGRSEASARRLGRVLARVLSWILRRFRRGPVSDLGPSLVSFRDDLYGLVAARWRFGASAVALNLGISFSLLLASLRFLGVTDADLPTMLVFSAFAAAFLGGTLIPISAGGLGVVDVLLFIGLDAASSVDPDILIAAVLVWRVFYDLVTIPVGAVTLVAFSRANPNLLAEARAELTSSDH